MSLSLSLSLSLITVLPRALKNIGLHSLCSGGVAEMAARALIALPPIARHALLNSPRSTSFSRFVPIVLSRPLLHRPLPAIAMSTAAADAAAAAPPPPPPPPLTASEKEESEFWEQVMAHQKGAAKVSVIEESRIVVNQCSSGILSTFSQKFEGFPYGSFLDYAADEDGSLVISISGLAPHRKDLEANGRCSVLIMKDKIDRSDVLVTYMGEASEVSELEQQKVRDLYLSKHPGAFWVDFGDFKFMRIQPKQIRFLSGIVTAFNRTGDFSGEEFSRANLDPVAGFSTPIATHMNKDHADETKLLVEKAIGVKVENAKIIDLDRLGLNVQVDFQNKPIKLRVPFPRPATDRKDVKTLIIQMLEG